MAESEHTRNVRTEVEETRQRWLAAVAHLDDDSNTRLAAATRSGDREEVLRIVSEDTARADEAADAWEDFERACSRLTWALVADELDT